MINSLVMELSNSIFISLVLSQWKTHATFICIILLFLFDTQNTSVIVTPEMKNKCLFPRCKSDDAKLRGLCRRHYNQAAKCISRGGTTWDKLVKAKKALAEGKRGPKIKNTHFVN